MSLTKLQFVEQGYESLNDYNQDNQWFGFLTGGAFERDWEPGQYICTAADCYLKATRADLKLMILGDDKIRRDHEIVGNFGLCTAMDGLEPDVKAIVERKERERAGTPPTPNAGSSSSSAVYSRPLNVAPPPTLPAGAPRVADQGAVLATRGWSPMLNDAFILGGVHSGFAFHLVLAQEDVQRFRAVAAGRPARDAWQTFFRQTQNQTMFWDPRKGKPRVFVREMIGLEAFGYVAEFDDTNGITFTCKDSRKAAEASLKKYIGALKPANNAAAGGGRGSRDFTLETEANVIGIAGDILFGSETALRG
jgi:hypothetical protein